MKKLRLLGIGFAVGIAAWAFSRFRETINPYEADGLQVQWFFGASSTFPTVDVWVDYGGRRITPDFFMFGGINNPTFRYRDYDGDGTRDIVFGDSTTKQVVSFKPATATARPRFVTLRNDVNWF